MRCGRCEKDKPVETFSKHKTSKRGYDWCCKECKKAIYQQHKEARRIYARARYQNDSGIHKLMRAQKRRHSAVERGSPEETAELIFYDKVYERDVGICQICKEPCSLEAGEIDHIIPCRHRGEHTYSNVQLAHRHCNNVKFLEGY